MKKRITSLCLALLMCISLTIPAMAVEQKITVNGETYPYLLGALMVQTQDEVTLRLDSDVQLTSSCVVLGSSDYDGLFGGQVMTVPSHDVTIDLNGYTLTGENGCAVFEVQSGYSLTIVDSSAAKTGKVVTQGDTVVDVQDGGSYTPLPEAPAQAGDQDGESSNSTGFEDVPQGVYCYEPVSWAVGKGITTGTTATTFSPNNTCTRAQIITFLYRAAGSPEPQGSGAFSDVDTSAYYAKAAQWAAEQGMASGSTFAPYAPCTRLMAVEFLWKQAGSPEAEAAAFTDVSSPAVDWAVSAGVTTGVTSTAFAPDNTCTRAQIVTFLYRAFAN